MKNFQETSDRMISLSGEISKILRISGTGFRDMENNKTTITIDEHIIFCTFRRINDK
jgi:hypothetical protein